MIHRTKPNSYSALVAHRTVPGQHRARACACRRTTAPHHSTPKHNHSTRELRRSGPVFPPPRGRAPFNRFLPTAAQPTSAVRAARHTVHVAPSLCVCVCVQRQTFTVRPQFSDIGYRLPESGRLTRWHVGMGTASDGDLLLPRTERSGLRLARAEPACRASALPF